MTAWLPTSARVTRAAGLALLATAVLGVAAASGAATAPPTGATGPTGPSGPTGATGPSSTTLPVTPVLSPGAPPVTLTSYRRQYTRWATTTLPGEAVRTAPSTHARTIARLHLLTSDGLPEVYQLLELYTDMHGTPWVRIAVPMRPNGVTGWVPEDDLGPFHLVRALLRINLDLRQITLYHNGRVVFRSSVGVGKPSTPTPTGDFWVREKFPVSPPVPLYGPYAIGTSDYSNVETDWPGGGVVGIHGTDQPNLIPGDPSHGCVRLQNPEITKLYPLVQIGTLIVIV